MQIKINEDTKTKGCNIAKAIHFDSGRHIQKTSVGNHF